LANAEFPFDMGSLTDSVVKKIQQYSLAGRLNSETIPIVRFADLDSDGYPDLLITLMANSTPQEVPTSKPFVYMNLQCINETCGTYNPAYTSLANVTDMRYYNPYPLNLFSVALSTINITNVRAMATYDFYQDGKQDFFINYYEVKKNKPTTYFIASILNNYPIDAFSLKLLCLNGVQSSTKATTNMFGVTYELKVTTLSGEYRHAVANQQFQLAHQALQSPNVIVGLGRTNNYVQDLTVGLTQNVQIEKNIDHSIY
jgi:integrin alpha FG-GAP repeat containing protein 1